MSQENVRIARALVDTWNRGDREAFLALWDDEAEFFPLRAQLESKTYRGHDGLERFMTEMTEQWDEVRFEVPAKLDPALGKEVETVCRTAFLALGCRDVARIDLRCDAHGKVHFIEVNPLPGLAPEFSDLCVIGKAAGMSYRSLIGEILAPALRRRERQLREHRKP